MEIKEIQDLIHKELILNGSSLTNFQPGSVTYTLTRSIAGAISELYLKAKTEIDNTNILVATDSNLDILGSQFNINRAGGSYASGYVLALNLLGSQNISRGVTLIDSKSRATFVISEDKVLGSNIETRLKVTAEDIGEVGNLGAGTVLINPSYPNVIFTVGDYRLSNGKYCGGLTGGVNTETDESYRQRIVQKNYSSVNGTIYEVTQKLTENPLVKNVWYEMLSPGVCKVWVDSSSILSNEQLEQINNSLLSITPAGLYTEISQIRIIPVDLSLQTEYNLTSDDIANIKTLINSYFQYITNVTGVFSSELSQYLTNVIGLSFTVTILNELPFLDSYSGVTFSLNKLLVSYISA